ncbi:MAG TPA: tetratricopeptide repeat protein [Anaerolineaceae bacterium]
MKVPEGTVIMKRYQVVRLLGEGGFGAVYLAKDTRLGDKKVALKQSFNTSPESQLQFRLEAQLLATLDHINLPRVTDHFADQGSLFLVMDYIEGEDLVERCAVVRGSAIPPREAASIMLQICDAVAYLHNQAPNPIIHRDIKPSNIKLQASGRAMLVDFGIAKLYQPTKGTVRVAKAVSPPFSPPEQYGGKTDMRSDIYSLGATLYVLLCKDELPDAMERSTHSLRTIPPHTSNPLVPPDLEAIVLKAIDLDPMRRFSSAAEMTAALRAFLGGQPVEVHGAQPQGQTGIPCPKCGTLNRPTARFCVRDGTPLSSSPTPSIPPEARFEIANEYANKQQYEKAIREYQLCLRDHFTHAAVYHNLGLCYRLASRSQEARFALTRGVTLYPSDPDLHMQLALTYRDLKDTNSAVASIIHACQLNPTDEKGNLSAIILMEAGRVKEAITLLEQMLRSMPESAVLNFQLGRAYFLTDQSNKAIQKFKKVIQANRSMAEAHFFLGAAYFQKDKYDLAIREFQEAIRLEPTAGPAYYLMAKAELSLKRYKEALQAFNVAAQNLVNDPDPYLGMAVCHLALAQRREALMAIERALVINPNNQEALAMRMQLGS